MTNPGKVNYYFKKNSRNKLGLFVKLVSGICETWKHCRKVTCLRSRNFQEENWLKIKTLLMNSRPEFRNYRMKLTVWMIREIVKMLTKSPVDHPTFPVNQRYFHLVVIQDGCKAATVRRQIFGTRRVYGETFFANPRASSSSPLPGGFNPWISNVTEDTLVHTQVRGDPLLVVNVRFQTQSSLRDFWQDRQPEIHST